MATIALVGSPAIKRAMVKMSNNPASAFHPALNRISFHYLTAKIVKACQQKNILPTVVILIKLRHKLPF
jgi:hypothetical protein